EVWGPMPGTERAKYVYRIARIIAERTRELAVLETLDNGKPIRESRDADIPTASAHFCSVTGARATGKTTTALQHVDTVVRLDRPEEAGAFAASPDATLAALPGRILLDE
ncbi:MAG: aldehyde dehydrogenase family protein, partial [Nocardioidaceae bacterium]